MPRWSRVLVAALCGAAAQTAAVWSQSLPGLLGAVGLFAVGGWLLAGVDAATRPRLDESGSDPETRRAGDGPPYIGVRLALLAVCVVTALDAASYTGEEFSAVQIVAYAVAVASVLAFAALCDRGRPSTSGRFGLVDAGMLLLVSGAAFAFRSWRLDAIPPLIWEDEIYYLQEAISLLSGEWVSPFATGEWGSPYAHAYSVAAALSLVTDRAVALRLVAAIPSALSVPLLFLALRDLLDRRFAFAAAFLFAIAAWNVILTRHGYVVGISVFAEALALYGLARGLRSGRMLPFAVCGVGLGVGVAYTYVAVLMPFVVVLLALQLAATQPRLAWSRRWGFALLVFVAVVVAAPRLTTYLDHPETREYQSGAFVWSGAEEFPYDAIAEQLGQIALSFNRRADAWPQLLPNANEPILDPVSAAAFGLGFFWALFSWRRSGAFLLLANFVLLLVPAAVALSITDWATAWRACGVAPGLFGLAGAPFAIAYEAMDSRRARFAVAVLLGACLALATLINVHTYFVRHPAKAVWSAGRSAIHQRAAETVLAAPPEVRVVVSADLEYPYLHALAWDRREYEALLWPDDRLLPDIATEARSTLVVASTRQFWEDDVTPGAALLQLIQHYYPRGRREDPLGSDGQPLFATYHLDVGDIAAEHGLRQRPDGLAGTLVLDRSAEVRVQVADGDAAAVRIDGREFGGGRLGAGLHAISIASGIAARDLKWSLDGGEAEPLPPAALLRRGLPGWGLWQTATSAAGSWQRWTPVLWSSDTDAPAGVDADAVVEWEGDFHLPESGRYTLLSRSRAPSTLWSDGEAMLVDEATWPEWHRLELELEAGWHHLRVRSQPPVEKRDLELIWLGPSHEPRLVGGVETRLEAPPQ